MRLPIPRLSKQQKHQEQSVSQAVFGLAVRFGLIVGALTMMTLYLQKRELDRFRNPNLRLYAAMSRGGAIPGMGTGGRGRGGDGGDRLLNINDLEPQPLPRFFATLARPFGEYIISVRQVIGNSNQQSLYNNPTYNLRVPNLQQAFISLQALSTNKKAVEKLMGFETKVVAIEDTGAVRQADSATKVVRFEQGITQIVHLPMEETKARYFKSVEGNLLLSENGTERRIPFRLTNIPLPVGQRVFGTASLAYIQTPRDAISDGSFRTLSSASTQPLLKAFPPYRPEPAPLQLPWRLLLTQGVENSFPLYATGSASPLFQCTIVPTIGADGEISGKITLKKQGASPFRGEFRMWDQEPSLFVLPTSLGTKEGKRLVLKLNLFLAFDNSNADYEEVAIPLSPFPTDGRRRGATIEGTLMANDTPLPRAGLTVEMLPIDERGKSATRLRKIRLVTNNHGRWMLGNNAPGAYRIRVLNIMPRRPDMVPNSDFNEFMKRRFGLERFNVENATLERVELQPGRRVILPTWRFTQTTGAQYGFELPNRNAISRSQSFSPRGGFGSDSVLGQ